MRKRSGKVLPAVRPNSGITVAYRKKIVALVREMATSYEHWLKAQYRATPPRMAQDAVPAAELERAMRDMGKYWRKRFDTAAPNLAVFFARSARGQSERVLKQILRDAGLTVRMTMTPALKDILTATVAENVSLIKSIQTQYHSQVEGLVMRSVTAGRDLATLTRELRNRYGITEDRAKLISLDQNNKATSALQRERQTAVGLERGIWMHSHAGKEPRPTHLANDGKEFSISKGWFDPDPKVRKRIWPGELIRCRCTWRPIVEGFS